MTHEKLLAYVQTEIEAMYELSHIADVNEYLITDKLTACILHGAYEQRDIDEKLLLRVNDDDILEIALYLDASVLEALSETNPLNSLTNRNLQAFLTMVEGVSHFVYVAHNAACDRPLSLFELELQSEIDKFIIVLRLLQRQGYPKQFTPLFKQLFENIRYSGGMSEQEYYRYRLANKLAAQYCQRLKNAMIQSINAGELMAELKRFYRYSHINKTRCIKRAA